MARATLQGSERAPLVGARPVGKSDASERMEVTVVVRRRGGASLTERVAKLGAGTRLAQHLSREDYAKQFGADPADLAKVKTFAAGHGLAVVQEDAARRTLVLSGTVGQFNAAFEVDLQQFEHDGGSYRGRVGALSLPQELSGVVDAVLGLDNRPQTRTHHRTRRDPGNVQWHPSAAPSTSFTPTALGSLYDFPAGSGQGQCIGIIELGGGYRPADLKHYFGKLGLPPPRVSTVSVDHGRNHPTGDPNGPDGEVMLDLEVAGAIAPGANLVVYFAPNTDAGFLDAITTAIHDTKHQPSVISISWGGPESSWTKQALTAFDEAFQAAAAMGVTVTAASGDNGSSDGVSDGASHVDFPASSPFALACGGTSLRTNGASISSEVVWNDGANGGAAGGGVSDFFPLPAWQDGLRVTKSVGMANALQNRGVPDVCADADPYTGYDVRVDGVDTVIGGTSAVAPLWAGLIARINASRPHPVGYINPQLYQNPQILKDITQGTNGTYAAASGWDACTGLGSPDGQKVAGVL